MAGATQLSSALALFERVLVSLRTQTKAKAMGWRLWWGHKVRRANNPRELRDRFEFCGERLVTLAIESGGSNRIGTELADLGQHKPSKIVAWLNVVTSSHNRRIDKKPSNGHS
jgi:hypothetical protein